MKLRYRLTIIITILTMVIIAMISVTLLRQARILQTKVAFENTKNLCYSESLRIQKDLEVFMNAIDTISKTYNSFDAIDMPLRRHYFDEILRSTVASNPTFVGIYSVWKLGVIDDGPPIYSTLYTREHSTKDQDIITRYDFSEWNKPEYGRCQDAIAANEAWPWMIPFPVPFVNRGNDIYAVFMTAPIIDTQTNELYGFVGVGVDITPMQESIINLRPYGTGMAQLISADGIITAHADTGEIGKNFHEETGAKLFGSEGIKDLEETMRTGLYHQTTYNGNIIVSCPIQIGKTKSYWSIVVEVQEKTVLTEVYQMRIFTIIFALTMVFIAAIIVFIIIKYSTKPISKVVLALKDISQGEGDLTQRIPEKGNDEITDMSYYFNLTLEKIKTLIFAIKKETGVLSGVGNDLGNNMNETAAAVNEITANIQSIKGRILNQSASVTETHATMEQVVTNINKLDGLVENQTNNVSRASSAIEEMVANIKSVTGTLANNAVNVQTLREASEVGRAGLEEVAGDIQGIARESEGLMEINSVMENIASQTNLLSMNAAIEAAHAGEAGKGFAVVADEIRKLAESSSEQSKTIGNVLKKIKSSIDKISLSTDNVLHKFEAIDSSVKVVSDQEDQIRSAMEEQGEGSKQILDGVGAVNEITRQVKAGSNEMLEGSTEVIRESTELEKATQEIASGINKMASDAEQMNATVHRVNKLSGKTREGIENLMKEVEHFKVD